MNARPFPITVSAATLLTAVLGISECPDNGPVVYEPDALDGYTLLSDFGTGVAYLIDMEGVIVKEWGMFPFPAKMLPGGWVMGGLGTNPESPFWSADTTDLSIVDWNGNEVWHFDEWDVSSSGTPMARQHHDFNTNWNPVGYYAPGLTFSLETVLAISHLNKVIPEVTQYEFMDDVIYEVDASGALTGFEWSTADHLSELGLDDAALQALHDTPNMAQLPDGSWIADPFHINSMSTLGENRWYDAGDQRFHPDNVIIDSRNASFLAIIDRRTGHVVWRVGPDFSSQQPWHSLGQIQGQHHVHMIPRGLPGEGDILVFDNGAETGYGANGYPQYSERGYTRVLEFNPTTYEKVWEYGGPSGEEFFYSQYIGSAQRLPNGSTLITDGTNEHVLEVTPDHRIVWEYFMKDAWWLYRAYRIPPEWLPEGQNYQNYPPWEQRATSRVR